MMDKHDFYRVILVTKTTDDGSKQAYYVRAFYAGCLFPGGATANTGVCESISIILHRHNLFFLNFAKLSLI